MKKYLLILLGVLIGLPIFAQDFTYTYEGQTVTYTVLDEEAKTCQTKTGQMINDGYHGGNQVSGDVILPSIVMRGAVPYTLIKIADGSFYGSGELHSIIVPESVSEIGTSAFDFSSPILVINNPELQFSHLEGSMGTFSRIICPPNFDMTPLDRAWWNNHLIRVNQDPENPITSIKSFEDGLVLANNGEILIRASYEPAFWGEEDYEIAKGVTTIKSYAFSELNRINELTIPSSIRKVESNGFGIYNYTEFADEGLHINRVNFEDWAVWYSNVKLGNLYSNPYLNCPAYAGGVRITTPELREGLTEIPDFANAGLPGYENEVQLPSTLKRIGAYAFYKNTELYNVFIPEYLEEIGEYAFTGCTLLENFEFPESLKKIGTAAFTGCTRLTEVYLPKGLTYLGDPTEPDYYDGRWQSKWPVTGTGVFEGCSSLEKISLATDIDYIAPHLLAGCTNLNKLWLPSNLKSIGSYAFAACNVDEITFPSSLERIGEYAFYCRYGMLDGSGLKKITIPDNVVSMGEYAFYGQPIEYLTIGKGLQTIPTGAFGGTSLKVVNFSEGLTTIETEAFYSVMSTIGSIVLPSTVTTIQERAFDQSSICELVIPDKVTSLPAGSCGWPSTLTLGAGIKEINNTAFGFWNLRSIRLKAAVPPSLNDAFPLTNDQNDALTLIVNNGRKKYYEVNARWKQIDRIVEEDETEVTIYMVGDYSLAEEIRTTTGLMPSNVTKMKVVGPLTANDLNVIGENMISLMSLDMSEVTGVTEIPEGLFENSLISEIILPVNLEAIGSRAFENCRLLKLTELPSTVKTISSEAFAYCPEIKISVLPESLENIGYNAFKGCGMTELVARDNLTNVEFGAFRDCTLLETVDLSATKLTKVEFGTFSGCTALDNVILSEIVTYLGGESFANTALRDIAFASGVSGFGDGAFRDCRRLVAANLPEAVTNVPSNMFANCKRLITLSMPEGTKSVGENVVYGDKKLANISCAAADAPAATKGAFDEVRVRYISLVVPTTSYRPYLNANQWGKFESIQNRIQYKQDKGVEVSVMLEDEYQDMLREDALEEAAELAAVEKAEESGDVNMKMLATARLTRGVKARAATPRYFAALFDGAQIQTGNDGGGARIFLNPVDGTEVTSILYKGEEMIYRLEGNTLLLPEKASGSLEIRTNYVEPPVLVESLALSDTEVMIKETHSYQLSVTITPEDAADKSVKWESSNPEVATVSEDGLIEAVAEGTCTITVTTMDGSELSASCEVIVDNENGVLKVAVDGIAVRAEGATIYVAGVEAGKAVSLYSMAGVHCATVVSDGSEIRFEAAPAQFYIVRAGKASIKVRL